jgi:hypothetical protein
MSTIIDDFNAIIELVEKLRDSTTRELYRKPSLKAERDTLLEREEIVRAEAEEPENYDEYISVRFAPDQEPVEVPATPPGKVYAESGWNPDYPQNSKLYDHEGNCLGVLVSIDPEVIAVSPGIQAWSKPAR